MAPLHSNRDPEFMALPMPLRNIGRPMLTSSKGFAQATQDSLHARSTSSAVEEAEGIVEVRSLQIGTITIVGGRTTPMRAVMGDDQRIVVNLCYAGAIAYSANGRQLMARANGMIAAPNQGGALRMTHLAGIAFALDRQRLSKTIRALCGTHDPCDLDTPFATTVNGSSDINWRTDALFALFREIDLLLLEDQRLPTAMGIDDQIYRLLALNYIARRHLLNRVGARAIPVAHKAALLDELVSYIETHCQSTISLSDLESHSHYSGRQLQNLFRERFDCTPMQFVRHQRLAAAMQQLQMPSEAATVAAIARGCGYRHTSSFSSDFHREFGVSPSTVLRSARGGGV